MFYTSDPPFFLLAAGLLISITSGLAFEAILKQAVQAWSQHRSTRTLANLQGLQLFLPFLGICGGTCIFLASGLQVFSFPAWLAYGIASPLTALSGALVWYQLGKVLAQLEKGGSRAIDLDAF